MNKRLTLVIIAVVAVVVVGVLTTQIIPRNPATTTTTTPISELRGLILQGAGATFPYPQISEWARRFQDKYGIQVVYQSVGSGAGQSMFLQKAVDFGCSDPPLSRDKWSQYKESIIQVPWLFGPVVIVYNIPELPGNYNLKLDGIAIARIYKGEITYWNDPYIKELNPEVADKLPNKEIIAVHRSDSSGTTEIFTTFLYKASSGVWPSELVGKSINWPVDTTGRGIGGKGNEGVTSAVVQTPYSIGYVEWSYAIKNNLRVASIKNAAGNFVLPTSETLQEALKKANIPSSPLDDFSGILDSVIYTPGEKNYPILGPSHILIWRVQDDPKKAEGLKLFLKWVAEEGYNYIVEGYIAPPENVRQLLVKAAELITTR
ncbi:MAG: phosphate ABC transporter substrate-binding protein PstS [Thermosphaera sp.]|nr:phosphate ABC transporter substrate-binding protein PstS [Thermosphaera sp.]